MGRWHADAVRKVGGRVTVIVDPNDAAREALGRWHPEARLAAELDPPFLARHATTVHVCTPLSTHADIVTAAVRGTQEVKGAVIASTLRPPASSGWRSRGVIVCPPVPVQG
jgi:hypothetical protein